jgi:hypothetical protein
MFLRIVKYQRIIASFLLINFLTLCIPIQTKALSSGPSQPETEQFAPAGMDNMVDPFTGDFSYNIPLMDVGGYPINMSYASGITPDAEASWTGLGWNLNVGAINRSVRGLPDDFAGDPVQTDFNVQPNETFGSQANVGISVFGDKLPVNVGVNANVFYNTYNGMGISMGIDPSISSSKATSNGFTANLGVSIEMGSETGTDITPSIGLSFTEGETDKQQSLSSSIGFPFNTRDGLKGTTLTAGYVPKITAASNAYNKSSFIGFSTPTYTPSITQSHINTSFSLGAGFTIPEPPTELGNFGFSGYYSGQFLANSSTQTPAYGYMYSGLSNSYSKLFDFNREKDGVYNKKYTQNLAVTNMTWDVFSVNGQGINGTYRLYRGDLGAVTDNAASDFASNVSANGSFGTIIETTNLGIGAAVSTTNSSSGKWSADDENVPSFNSETNHLVPTSEKVYFKKIGESLVENDNNFLNNVQHSTDLLQYGLQSSIFGIANNTYTNGDQVATTQATNARSQRPNKTTTFTTLSVAEAMTGNILPMQNYVKNNFYWQQGQGGSGLNPSNTSTANFDYQNTVIPRNSGTRKNQHISEVRVTDESGSRYVYGIPVYNNIQHEITFAANTANNATGHITAVTNNLVGYDPNADLGNTNGNGVDHYYNHVTTPGNAHSYLLTCILSSDYVDSDNIPGPSDGDLGTYTKFNYAKLTDSYNWRTPMTPNLPNQSPIAGFSDGMTGTMEDDKGNIIWGTKEVWYLHSIETPTHVAEFYLSDRMDGFGSNGQDGGINTGIALQKLDKIVLYSKADKSNSSAEPVKTVYFSYDYSLCPGTINSTAPAVNGAPVVNGQPLGQGKLTLKKVWFTYGNSQRGVLNPYVFTYADQNFDGAIDYGTADNSTANLNPTYSSLNYDRWGYFNATNDLINAGTTIAFVPTPISPYSIPIQNSYFPYTPQESQAVVDANAAVYALSTIQTPTGGTMHVVYESDDYAYVQDKQAMRMFSISNTVNGISTNGDPYYYLDIDLGEGFTPSSNADPLQQFLNSYIGDIDMMYFKINMNVINGQFNPDQRWEYVPGYAEINQSQCSLPYPVDPITGNYTKARIALNPVSCGNTGNVNPISRAGWMYAKINLGRQLKGLSDASNLGVEQIMYALISELSNLINMTSSFSTEMIHYGHSNTISAGSSIVRLLEPDQIKFGGGHRVKAIVMSDHWAMMKSTLNETGSTPLKETALYGQSYTYRTTTADGTVISSGVAAYEPILGGEENPFRQPVFVTEKAPMAASTVYFLDEPFGECFFPAPSVGYSKVIVTPLKLTSYNDVLTRNFNDNGTGYVQQEFYTAKDFPTYTERTALNTASHNPNLLSKFLKLGSTDLATVTQGYYIENNDMHGKSKAKRVFPETFGNTSTVAPQAISEVEYYYKVNSGNDPSNPNRTTILDNTVTTINPDLTINSTPSTMGVDVDVVNDEREYQSTTTGGGLNLNTKDIQILALPVVIPIIYPDISWEYVQFRSLVTTKVVNRYGILQSTIAKDNGAAITTTNLAWDGKTGDVLLSSIQNEYNDLVYTFNYPAHWAYPRMKHASSSEGLSFTFTNAYLTTQLANPVNVPYDPNNPFSNPSSQCIFNDGDELYLDNGVVAYLNYNASQWDLLDASGASHLHDTYTNAKVIRSGARNMPSTAVGTIVTKTNPMLTSPLTFQNVMNTGASEYSENWKRMGCDCANASTSTNPYILGLKGNLRPFRSWTYLTDRYQKLINNNMALRTDGYYKDFTPFWLYNSSTGLNNTSVVTNSSTSKWQFVTQITNYNSLGMEIENMDALGRYMMAQYGYGRKLPVATSNNSQFKESGFDGFEDYGYNECTDDHLSWRNAAGQVTNHESHTGRNSIAVPAGTTLPITKVIENCQ